MGNSDSYLDLQALCGDLEWNLDREVSRENLLDTLDDIVGGETRLVLVEGDDGYGKTALLRQYCRRHSAHCLALFINPCSRLAYAPEYLTQLLCPQIDRLLGRPQRADVTDPMSLHSRLVALDRRGTTRRERYFVVVDGLEDMPAEASRALDDILRGDILPFGLSPFRFAIAGSEERIAAHLHRNVKFKTFRVPRFTLEQSRFYLSDLVPDADAANSLHRMAGAGIPGHLASIRRMLISGVDVAELLEAREGRIPDFIAAEWDAVSLQQEERMTMAVMANCLHSVLPAEIARVLSIPTQQVIDAVAKVPFVVESPNSGRLSFVSDAHRKYVASKLASLKAEATNLIVDDLLREATSDAALTYLPDYLEQAGRQEEILERLDLDHFTRVIERTQSLGAVFRRADLGARAALSVNKTEVAFGFCLRKSVVAELDGVDIWQSEIEARVALGEHSAALALARTAIMKEDRLHMLAVVARMRVQEGLWVEPELVDEIRLLYEQLDPASLGQRADALAAELLWIDPDLAIEVVEEATGPRREEVSLDWAFARLSMAAYEVDREGHLRGDATDKALSKIRNPELQTASLAVSMLVGDSTAEQTMATLRGLRPSHQIFFLRQWLVANPRRGDAVDLVDYSLNLLIGSTDYTPKTGDLRDFAAPLPYVQDELRLRHQVKRFDVQIASVEGLGTTEDLIGLQLTLAEAESHLDLSLARKRVLDAYYRVSSLAELAVRCDCLALIVAALPKIDQQGQIEAAEGLLAVSQNDLRICIEQLLAETADHDRETQNCIRTLAEACPSLALDLASRLNTQERRDRAHLHLATAALAGDPVSADVDLANQAIQSIASGYYRDRAFSLVVHRLVQVCEGLREEQVTKGLEILQLLCAIQDPRRRCDCCCQGIKFVRMAAGGKHAGIADRLRRQFEETWDTIDVGWSRVDVGFKAAKELAKLEPETARRYLTATDGLKAGLLIDAAATAWTFRACLELAIKAHKGLLKRHADREEDTARLQRLIEKLPSVGQQADFWAGMALRYALTRRSDDCRDVVKRRVLPLAESLASSDAFGHAETLISVAPALYEADATVAEKILAQLDTEKRDAAYSEVCHFLLTRTPAKDPYKWQRGSQVTVDYPAAIRVCQVIASLSVDNNAYSCIAMLADALVSRSNREMISGTQFGDLCQTLDTIVETKFPDLHNITHDGYKLLGRAQLARLKRASSGEWKTLVDNARCIPNLSDRAFVLGQMAGMQPPSESRMRAALAREAKALVDQIPADSDRVDRLYALALETREFDPELARECLAMGMRGCNSERDETLAYGQGHRILDFAQRISPALARELASSLDNDPARARLKAELSTSVREHDIRDTLVSGNPIEIAQQDKDLEIYCRAAWSALAELNAGRSTTARPDQAITLVAKVADMPLSKSYPVYAWAIENEVRRFENTDEATSRLVPLFEETLLAAELSERIAARSAEQLERIRRTSATVPVLTEKTLVVGVGERAKALEFLEQWLGEFAADYVKFCDPYFDLEDFEILRMIRSSSPGCQVEILTSRTQLQKFNFASDDDILEYWRRHISTQDPPVTTIVAVGTREQRRLPIHDRWILTKNAGLRVGTSLHDLGRHRVSEISRLTASEALRCEEEVDAYLSRRKIVHERGRLLYSVVTLAT